MTMTRQGNHHTVRFDLTGLTLLIITTKQSVTFYGKMYGKVQYRTPIPSHVPVKVIVENYYNRETVEQKAMFTLYKVRVKLMFTLYIAKCEHEFYSTLYKMCT